MIEQELIIGKDYTYFAITSDTLTGADHDPSTLVRGTRTNC